MENSSPSNKNEQPSSDLFGQTVTVSLGLVEKKGEIDEFIENERLSGVAETSGKSSSVLYDPRERFRKGDLLSKRVHEHFQQNTDKLMGDSLFHSQLTQSNNESPVNRDRSNSVNKSPMTRLGSAKSIHSPGKLVLEPIEENNVRHCTSLKRNPALDRSTSKQLKKTHSKNNLVPVAKDRNKSSDSLDKREKLAKRGIGSPKAQVGKLELLNPKAGKGHIKEGDKANIANGATDKVVHVALNQNLPPIVTEIPTESKSAISVKSIEVFEMAAEKHKSSRKGINRLSGPASKINSRDGSQGKGSVGDVLAPLKKIISTNNRHNNKKKVTEAKSTEPYFLSASPDKKFLKKGDGQMLKKTVGTKTHAELTKSNEFHSNKTIPTSLPKVQTQAKVNPKNLLPIPPAATKTKEGTVSRISLRSTEKTEKQKKVSPNPNLPSDISREQTGKERLDESDINLLKKASCKLLPNIHSKDLVSDSFDDVLLKEAKKESKAGNLIKGLSSQRKVTQEEALAQLQSVIKEHFNQRKEKV